MEGQIILVNVPTAVRPGDKLVLELGVEVYDPDRWATDYWTGNIVVSGNGQELKEGFSGFGDYIGTDWVRTFNLGYMPDSDVTVQIELNGLDMGWGHNLYGVPPPYGTHELLATETVTVTPIRPDENEEDDDDNGFEEFPWKWAGIAVAGLFAGTVIRRLK